MIRRNKTYLGGRKVAQMPVPPIYPVRGGHVSLNIFGSTHRMNFIQHVVYSWASQVCYTLCFGNFGPLLASIHVSEVKRFIFFLQKHIVFALKSGLGSWKCQEETIWDLIFKTTHRMSFSFSPCDRTQPQDVLDIIKCSHKCHKKFSGRLRSERRLENHSQRSPVSRWDPLTKFEFCYRARFTAISQLLRILWPSRLIF